MASGALSPLQVEDEDYMKWVSALALLKVSERPVEGLRSRISKIQRRAPRASPAYISLELRFDDLCQLVSASPQAMKLLICVFFAIAFFVCVREL